MTFKRKKYLLIASFSFYLCLCSCIKLGGVNNVATDLKMDSQIRIVDTLGFQNPLRVSYLHNSGDNTIIIDSVNFITSNPLPLETYIKEGKGFLFSTLFYSYFDADKEDSYYENKCERHLNPNVITNKINIYSYNKPVRFLLMNVQMKTYDSTERYIGYKRLKIDENDIVPVVFPLCLSEY